MDKLQKFSVRRPLMVFFAISTLLASIGIAAGFGAGGHHQNLGDATAFSAILMVLAVLLWSITWRSSIRVEPASLNVRNMFYVTRIPWSQVRDITLDDGLTIHLKDGTMVKSIQFGGSIIGAITGYPTYRKSVRKLQSALKDHRSVGLDCQSVETQPSVSVSFIFPTLDAIAFLLLFAIPAFTKVVFYQ